MSKSPRSASRSPRSSTRTRRPASKPDTRSASNAAPTSHAALDSFDLEDEFDSFADALAADRWSEFAAQGRATRKKADPAAVAMGAPWVKNGIDYGPARAALHDLAVWTLDLAEREVGDVPADRKHVRNVRDAILGTTNRKPSTADLMFTAEVLARVFDRDLDLGLADQLAIFDQLELTTDVLPLWSAPRAATPLGDRTPMRVPTPAVVEPTTPTVRIRLEISSPSGARTPPPLRFCHDCGYVHEPNDHVRHYRNAA